MDALERKLYKEIQLNQALHSQIAQLRQAVEEKDRQMEELLRLIAEKKQQAEVQSHHLELLTSTSHASDSQAQLLV